jgi:hypothetical protein
MRSVTQAEGKSRRRRGTTSAGVGAEPVPRALLRGKLAQEALVEVFAPRLLHLCCDGVKPRQGGFHRLAARALEERFERGHGSRQPEALAEGSWAL